MSKPTVVIGLSGGVSEAARKILNESYCVMVEDLRQEFKRWKTNDLDIRDEPLNNWKQGKLRKGAGHNKHSRKGKKK